MIAATRGPEFTPPPQPGLLRSVGLALLAHVVLVLALSWGLKWKSDDGRIAVEAELWSPSVQQAAPKPVEVPPAPRPAPPPPPPPAPAQPDRREADIALEREKERAAQEKARQDAERERQAAERRRQDEQRKQDQAKKAAEERKQDQARKAAEERKKAEETVAREKREQDKRDEERRAKLREETMKRMQGLAGATGSPTSEGTALRSSGPSSSYAGVIRGRVRPNIVFTDDIPGNPSAEVLVQLSPDGTIVGRRITKTSGVKTWDDAVLRALDRTAEFPRDRDGRVPSSMVLVFRPRE